MNIRELQRQRQAEWAQEMKEVQEAKEKELKERENFQTGWHKATLERKNYIKEHYKGQVFDKKNRPDKSDFTKINSGEILVETAGFIPLSEQVRRFDRAGLNLQAEMAKRFDYSPIDTNRDGFKDSIIAQYPDKIEAFELIQTTAIESLKKAINERELSREKLKKDDTPPKPEPEPEPEPKGEDVPKPE